MYKLVLYKQVNNITALLLLIIIIITKHSEVHGGRKTNYQSHLPIGLEVTRIKPIVFSTLHC